MQRVAVYIRVSTEEQAKEGFSISAQRQRLMSYSQSMEWDIYDIYIDEGYSGAKSDRPELNRLRGDIKNKSFDLVLVWKVDRFFRSVYYLSEMLHQMDKSEVGFVSMTESFNTATPSGKAMLQMLAIFAEFERETIRERVIENLAERARQGLHHGKPPYGYTSDENKHLVVVSEQSQVVKRIFELRSKGKSYNQIRTDIQKRYQPLLHTDDSDTLFYFVQRILENPVYTGKVTRKDNPLPGIHEPIISDELFQIVQKRAGSRHDKHSYLYQGLIYCGMCGARMTSKMRKTDYGYKEIYYCPNSRAKHKPSGNYTCTASFISEKHVTQQLVKFLNNFQLSLDDDIGVEDHTDDELKQEITDLDKKISDLRKRKNRYFLMFEEDPEFEQEAKDRIKEITSSIREFETQKDELESAMTQTASSKDMDVEQVKQAISEISATIERADKEHLAEIVRLFFDRINVYKIEGLKPAPGRTNSYIEPIWIQDNL